MLVSLPFDLEGARVLDFFAGSGSLGLEALSRGADFAVFADHSREALTAVRRNLESIGLTNAELLRARWPQGFQHLSAFPPFNLFFLDPPYQNRELPLQLLKETAARSLAAPGAVAVWEQSPASLDEWTEEEAVPWNLLKTRVWGSRAAAFFMYEPAQ